MAVKGAKIPKHVALTMTVRELDIITACMAHWNEGIGSDPLNEEEQEILDTLLRIRDG